MLPARPHLDQLRRQAKELRDAALAGDPAALERMGDLPLTLATAQLAIARAQDRAIVVHAAERATRTRTG